LLPASTRFHCLVSLALLLCWSREEEQHPANLHLQQELVTYLEQNKKIAC